MPASSASDARDLEGAIRAAVIRLARPDGDGGAVIERAAIVAEGESAVAIEAWVVEHGGKPEAPLITGPHRGLYELRHDCATLIGERPPRRYVLPLGAIA